MNTYIHILTYIPPLYTLQAWQAAVQNLQSQLAHQENRLLNTEIASEHHLANTYLKHNNTLEQISNTYTTQIEHLNRDIRNVNKTRQSMQTKAYPELNKLQHKIAMSMDRTWKCQLAYTSIREEMKCTYYIVYMVYYIYYCIVLLYI